MNGCFVCLENGRRLDEASAAGVCCAKLAGGLNRGVGLPSNIFSDMHLGTPSSMTQPA
jgi:hypothetical protein